MILKTKLTEARDSILDLIFPPRCVGCGSEGDFLCDACIRLLPTLPSPFCERCGIPVTDGKLCPKCSDFNMAIDGIRSPFLHEGLAREMIHQLKYHHLKVLAKPMAELLEEFLTSVPLPCDIITPVPSHPDRVRSRGYNQAALLAYELGHRCSLPVFDKGLVRVKNTSSQVSLGLTDRWSNVEGAFRCRDHVFEDRSVLLIDDVCTTGATLNSCAKALKAAGAATVCGLTLSRECLTVGG